MNAAVRFVRAVVSTALFILAVCVIGVAVIAAVPVAVLIVIGCVLLDMASA